MKTAFLIGIIATLLAYLDDKRHIKGGLLFGMLIITAFVAIRYEWGNDMPRYLFFFNDYEQLGSEFWNIRFSDIDTVGTGRTYEIGWAVLNVVCQPIGFFGMTILLSIVENVIVYQFIKEYVPRGYYSLAVFIYFFNTNMLVLGCSMMRQFLAMCIILLAIQQLLNNKKWRFVLLVFLAASFHNSAIVCLLMYFLFQMRNVKVTEGLSIALFVILALWTFVFSHFIIPLFPVASLLVGDQYSSYVGGQGGSAGIATLAILFIATVCLYTSEKIKSENLKVLSWIYLGFVIITPISIVIPAADRLFLYFEEASIAAVPFAMKGMNSKPIRIGVISYVALWNLYQFFMFFQSRVWRDAYLQYHTIFEANSWM